MCRVLIVYNNPTMAVDTGLDKKLTELCESYGYRVIEQGVELPDGNRNLVFEKIQEPPDDEKH